MTARPAFQRQLDGLQGAILTLGQMVDTALGRAADALERRSVTMARRVVREDGRINRHRGDVEATALHLLGLQQPMASDLRFLTSALHMATDLERMGDQGANVGRCVLRLLATQDGGGVAGPDGTVGGGAGGVLAPPPEVLAMAALGRTRLRETMAAFRTRDAAAAAAVARRDGQTDALQDTAYRALLATMRARPAAIAQATALLRAAYAFERVGDHVTNLCERVVYIATGRLEELNASPGEDA